MKKHLFESESEAVRKQMLHDNCDAIESIGYTRSFTPEELAEKKDQLSEVCIEAAEIEEQKKLMVDEFKAKLKPFNERKTLLLGHLKHKSEYVKEDCYKMIDHEEGMVGYYNSNGDLIESRPVNADERQKRIPLYKAVNE